MNFISIDPKCSFFVRALLEYSLKLLSCSKNLDAAYSHLNVNMVHKFNCIAPFLSNSLLIKYFKREGRLSKHFTAIMLPYNHVNRLQIPRDNFMRRNHSNFLLLL